MQENQETVEKHHYRKFPVSNTLFAQRMMLHEKNRHGQPESKSDMGVESGYKKVLRHL